MHQPVKRALVEPMDDFERHQLHEILRDLASQLYAMSAENVEMSKSEQLGNLLSKDDYNRRVINRERMTQIEDLITGVTENLVRDRA